MLAEPRIWPASKKVTADARRQRDRLVVGGDAAEGVAGVERVKGRIEWRAVGRIASARAVLRPATGILFLQMGRVEHHQPGQFARRAGRDDLAAEAAFVKQRARVRNGRDGRG